MAARKKNGAWGPASAGGAGKRTIADAHDVNLLRGDHYITRERINDFARLMRTLPDPDPILRKMGRGITALQELLTDSHLESVWTVRCAATSGAEWVVSAGGGGSKEKAAAGAFTEELKKMDVPRIIEEMMDAVAYGFSPLEVLWKGREDGRWGIDNIVGKPPQWFEFDRDNNLALKNGINTRIELPENRILLVQHRPSYANPYGEKIFSKVFWPVTFKKNGFQWWTVFVEKYGSPFMFGTYPSNAGQEFKDELLRALEAMASNSVAAVPEGSTITISGADDKGGSNNAYHSYLQTANAEISKAILGETLTTEIGETGSYAAAKTHNEVREHIAVADRRRIAGAFSRLAAVYCFYNFGEETAPPRFEFIEDEDLKIERARRDAEICKTTWRPTRDYFIEKYGMDPKHFTLADEDAGSGESEAPEEGGGFMFMKRPADCTCGYRRPGKKNLLQKAALLFASRGERDAERARGLTAEFENEISGEAQKETDALIDGYIDALGLAHDYDEAREVLVSHYEKNSPARCAALIGEGRYAAGQIGAWSVKKRGKRRG